MLILVVNFGSSSVKYTLFKMPGETVVAAGHVDRLGREDSELVHREPDRDLVRVRIGRLGVEEVVARVKKILDDRGHAVDAVGHRVVHGKDRVSGAVLVDSSVKRVISDASCLAPLHNPANLSGICACERLFPNLANVAVFDTAFFAKLPRRAYMYALPRDLSESMGIRRYGFHGTSHRFVARAAADYIKKPLSVLRMITCHIGNGCSICAVSKGVCVDTSMGFTPLEGLVMGTRCGDMDPSVVLALIDECGMSTSQVRELLNRKSGLLGLTGLDKGDFRSILRSAQNGNRVADDAIELFCYRIRKYIGSYMAVLGGVDLIVFTGGIGLNSPEMRQRTCSSMYELGIHIDEKKNLTKKEPVFHVHSRESRIGIIVVKTDEELEIARQTYRLLLKFS